MIIKETVTRENARLASRIKSLGIRRVAREANVDYSNLAKAVKGELPINRVMEAKLNLVAVGLLAPAKQSETERKVKLTAVVRPIGSLKTNIAVYVSGKYVGNLTINAVDYSEFMTSIKWAHVQEVEDE